jgi:hypothetical protein
MVKMVLCRLKPCEIWGLGLWKGENREDHGEYSGGDRNKKSQ